MFIKLSGPNPSSKSSYICLPVLWPYNAGIALCVSHSDFTFLHSEEKLQENERSIIEWLIIEPFSNQKLEDQTSFDEAAGSQCLVLELGPR